MTTPPDLDARVMAAIGEAMPMRSTAELRIDAETRLYADLGLDSLGLLALLYRLQEDLAVGPVEEPDVDIGELRTVGDLFRVVRIGVASEPDDEVENRR